MLHRNQGQCAVTAVPQALGRPCREEGQSAAMTVCPVLREKSAMLQVFQHKSVYREHFYIALYLLCCMCSLYCAGIGLMGL